MMKAALVVALGGFLAGTDLGAAERPKDLSLGVQAGLVLPVAQDLRSTTGSSPILGLGIHATWIINGEDELRPRVDLWSFGRRRQDVETPLAQRIETKVQGLAVGVDYLFSDGRYGRYGRWAGGPGVYLIRWSVASSNQVVIPGAGTAQASGTSRWTRAGFGVVGTYRFTPWLEVEARWISSHYGYENLSADLGTLGLLWHF